MKIMLLITGLEMGGAERQVCDLADRFISEGHQILLVSLTGNAINRPQSSYIKLVELNMKKNIFNFIFAYRQLRKLINEFRPDIVHSHMIHANLFARLLRMSSRIPRLICTAHSTNEGSKYRMLAYRMTDWLCDINTNVSQEAVNVSIRRKATTENKIIHVSNGIDVDSFIHNIASRERLRAKLGLANNTPLLLAVGRLTAAKDYPNLLSAFSKLLAFYEGIQLAIIGIGEEQDKLVDMIMELGLTERIHLLGLQRNINEWMSAADIYVMSSAWEGMPLVLLEAMACERVVVATDCGGVKEVLGDAGILVPAKNSEALAAAMNQALSLDPITARKLGAQAREHVIRNYSLDAVAAKWIDLYKR